MILSLQKALQKTAPTIFSALCAIYCFKCFTYFISFDHHSNVVIDIILPILQKEKQRHKEVCLKLPILEKMGLEFELKSLSQSCHKLEVKNKYLLNYPDRFIYVLSCYSE